MVDSIEEPTPSTTQRTLLIQRERGDDVRVTVPEDTVLTFGPWSPANSKERVYNERALAGTLRVYKGPKSRGDIILVQSGVLGYRDISQVSYEVKVATQEVSTVWKSDQNGYREERTGSISESFVDATSGLLPSTITPDDEEGEEAF